MRKRLFAVAVAALFPALGLLSYNEFSVPNARYAEVHAESAMAARHMAAEVDRIMEGTRSLINLLAANVVGTRFIIRPIEQIIGVMRSWADGNTSARTKMAGRHGELGEVGVAVDELLDELDRRAELAREAENAKELVSRELAHRVKNTMAIIQVIAKQTFKRLGDTAEFAAFASRLSSLSSAYDVLLSRGGLDGGMSDVIKRAIAPHDDNDIPRFVLTGPDVRLPAAASLALSLTIHELATNAAKYGALQVPGGRVAIRWTESDGTIRLHWEELGGPEVETPSQEGFGSLLIRRSFPQEFSPQADFEFRPEGLSFTLLFSVSVAESNAEVGT